MKREQASKPIRIFVPLSSLAVLALPALLTLLVPARAAAEDKAGEAAPDTAPDESSGMDLAKEYMELGQALYASGKYEEAADSFLKAYGAQPFSAFLYNTGVAYEKAGAWAKAAEQFRRYLETEPAAPDLESIKARIASLDEKAKASAGSTPDQPPTFTVEKTCGGEGQPPCTAAQPDASKMKSIVQVRTTPEGAKVTIVDEKGVAVFTGSSPLQQTVDPGKYKLVVKHPEYKEAETPLHVSEGRVYVVVVELSQGTFLGYLTVKASVPGARVFFDDHDAGAVGKTPWGNVIPTGDHTVWIEQPGYVPVEKQVSIGVGDSLEIDVVLERVEFGEIMVVANVDDAVLTVDGQLEQGLLGKALELPWGKHEVAVQAKGLKTWTTPVDLEKGKRTKILVRLNPKPKRTPAWISFGFATALWAAAIAFGVQSENLYAEVEKDKKAGLLDNRDPRFNYILGWDIAFDVTLLFAALTTILGIVYMVRDPLPDSEGLVKEPVELAEIEEYAK